MISNLPLKKLKHKGVDYKAKMKGVESRHSNSRAQMLSR